MKKMNSSAIDLFKYKMAIVGMVNILVLSAVLGIQGAGYLGISLALLTFLISFHSCWLSALAARYVRGRNTRNQHKSSRKFLKGVLIYVFSTGAAFCALFILASEGLGSFLIRDIHINICMMVIAVILLVHGICEAVSGYLQGMGFYMPVKIFLLVKQAAVFAGSIAGMKLLEEYGGKVARLKHNEAVTSVYGAFGSLLGMLAGNMAGLILLLMFCLLLHGELRSMRSKDNARYQESSFHGFRVMLGIGLMQGIKYALLFSPLLINYILYIRLCKTDGDSTLWIKTGGFLFGEAVPVMAVLILGFVLINHKNYRQLTGYWKNEAYSQFREKVYAMLLGVFLLALPVCAAVSVLSEPILKCLTKEAAKEGSSILLYAAAGAVLLILEQTAVKLMELWNETLYLYLITIVSFAVQTVFAVTAFKAFDLGVSGIMFGGMLQAILFVIFFFVKFSRRLKLSGMQLQKLVMALILAMGGALIMLVIYLAVGKKLSAGIAVAVSVVPGLLLYLAVVTILRIVSDKDAACMPGGELFLWLNRILHR